MSDEFRVIDTATGETLLVMRDEGRAAEVANAFGEASPPIACHVHHMADKGIIYANEVQP